MQNNVIPLYWSEDYIVAKEAFDTTRKSGWIVNSLRADPIPGLQILQPEPITKADLAKVHDPRYIEAIATGLPRAIAESQGFRWDPGLWRMACAHASGMVAAAIYAYQNHSMAGTLSSGLHHAGYDSGAGFCTFNGIALAAVCTLGLGAKRVLIIDLDAHCGGGTNMLIAEHDKIIQLDIAVNPFDSYRPRRPSIFDFIESADKYLPTIQSHLEKLARRSEVYDLCIYYSGMDVYEKCSIGGLGRITFDILQHREEMVFAWCREQGIPVAFGVGGGYTNDTFNKDELVQLHRQTLLAAVSYSLTSSSNLKGK